MGGKAGKTHTSASSGVWSEGAQNENGARAQDEDIEGAQDEDVEGAQDDEGAQELRGKRMELMARSCLNIAACLLKLGQVRRIQMWRGLVCIGCRPRLQRVCLPRFRLELVMLSVAARD